ncbi:MAG: citryl-CoA lyase [Sphingomonadaceae bacterium]|nr:citryl-CoA lyase [Sphingomonadaceae bacterium]
MDGTIGTRIGSSTADISRLKMRGADVLTDIVGKRGFAETFYFIICARWPTPAELRIFEAATVILMDHGITNSALVTRLVADSSPGEIQIAMAAGMTMVGSKFAGTMAGAGALLQEGMAYDGDKAQWASETAARFRADKKPIPGFGHPYYKGVDPRAKILIALTREARAKGDYLDLLELLSQAVDAAAGRPIVVNATAVLGAMLSEVGFPVAGMRAVAAVSRAAGLAAHVLEEWENPITPTIMASANAIEYIEDA